MAGRREVPVDPEAGPVQRFAFELRRLRAEAGGTTYRDLAKRAGYSITTLSQAAAGEQLPTLPVALAYAAACGGDAAEWELRWKQAVEEIATSTEEDGEGGEPPYRGLARFETGDRGLFFGRDRLTADLLELLSRRRVAAMFGPSGSGKSSLLRAGLIPALQNTQRFGGLRPAAIRILTPGERPARTHAALLTPSDTDSGPADTLVIVDQFEEVFTLCHDLAERARFLDLLLAGRRPESRLRVLIAVRADFYGRCAEHRDLAEALRDANLLVGPMTPSELRDTIIGPAAAEGLTVERALTSRLVEEVADAPGGLPLLSHVLLETWRRRRGKLLTVAGYEAAGGLEGAVAKTAEDVYARFTQEQAVAARHMLLRLVAPGEGTPDTRRPARREELEAPSRREAAQVLEALARARLLTLDDTIVEIAHEAFLTAWPRLRGWIEEDRERLRGHRKLTEAAQAWEQLGRDAGALYRGSRLITAQEQFGSGRTAGLTDLEHAFLTASVAARDQEQDAAVRAARRLSALTATLSVLLVLAVTASLIAWRQTRTSDQQRRAADAARHVALSRQLAAQSAALIGTNPDLASLLAVQAYRTDPTTQALESLYAASAVPLQRRLMGLTGSAVSVAFAPDGGTLATGSDDGLQLWDISTGRLPGRRVKYSEATVSVAFSPDGRTLATVGLSGGVQLWNATTGSPHTNSIDFPESLGTAGSGPTVTVYSVAFTPDGSTLATGSDDGIVRLWDTGTGRLRGKFAEQSGGTRAVAFAPDGRTLATRGDDGTVRLWDTEAGRSQRSFPGRASGEGATAVFSPDGRLVASDGADGTVMLWDTGTGRLRGKFAEQSGGTRSVAFAPDGSTLAGGGDDGMVRLWDISTGRLRRSLPGHAHGVSSMAFAPDGRTLATASDDGLRLWDMTAGQSRTLLSGHIEKADSMVFGPDGRTLATGSSGVRPVRLWDMAAGRLRASLAEHTKETASMAFAPDGRTLATGSNRFGVELWDTATGRLRGMLDEQSEGTRSVAFAPDGRTLATAGNDGLRLWDTATGRLRRKLVVGTAVVASVAFAPDGHTLATGGDDGTVRLWDTRTGRSRRSFPGHAGQAASVVFSPDGRALATGGVKDRTVRLWDTVTGHSLGALARYTGQSGSVAFSPDGRTLATGSSDDHTVRLWDTDTGGVLATLSGHTGPLFSMAFSPDGRTLITGSADQTVRRWDVALPTPTAAISKICRAVGRDLSPQERAVYLPDQPPHTACPGAPGS
ncbi:helix-turn-helix domain-containing protein [Streptomyces sp. NPDC053048]|uniref:nSTAND1 domain-containing NTPase n=1 Tax=Streptomyces sp. NPDC053048 TaxID=3365694 RepID=UPI0037CD628E